MYSRHEITDSCTVDDFIKMCTDSSRNTSRSILSLPSITDLIDPGPYVHVTFSGLLFMTNLFKITPNTIKAWKEVKVRFDDESRFDLQFNLYRNFWLPSYYMLTTGPGLSLSFIAGDYAKTGRFVVSRLMEAPLTRIDDFENAVDSRGSFENAVDLYRSFRELYTGGDTLLIDLFQEPIASGKRAE